MKVNKKILVTGCRGQLGTELQRLLGDSAVYTDRDSLDLSRADEVEDFLRRGEYDYIVNCAAYTAVDRAEEEKLECARANVEAVENLAKYAAATDARILHISTDYVFDGEHCHPYVEGDKPNPLSVYGSTKRRGETALIGLAPESMIIRTGWLYSDTGHNFVRSILDRVRSGGELRVVADQIGTPTYAADLAQVIVSVLDAQQWTPGVFHYSDEGVASWYDFAVAILEEAGIDAAVTPISTSDYPTAATRPAYSVLDKSKIKATFGIKIPHWRASLRRCISRINNG